ncbi:MAG: radical SAM protein [Candidatus Omnitrophica bacterium]|nr:radical SAM protein [Candidatus Omnitrophota bacterium]
MEKSLNFKNNGAVPTYCCIALLESCFMKCKMCYKWKDDVSCRSPKEPSLNQWQQFIRDLGDLCRQRPQLNFAGGEPLAKEETLPLIAYAAKLGFDTLLASNAYLINEEKAKAIADSGLSCISISLDSVNSYTHDFLRGTTGSFDRVIKAIELLSRFSKKIRINLCTVISAVNLGGLTELVEWAAKDERIEGIGFQAITQPFSTPEDENWHKNPQFSFLWPDDITLVDDAMAALIMLKEKFPKNQHLQIYNPVSQFKMYARYFKNPRQFIKKQQCHLDECAVNITPEGDIHICFYKSALGNIKESRIPDFWFSDKAQAVRQEIKNCRRNCQALVNCNFDEDEEYVE